MTSNLFFIFVGLFAGRSSRRAFWIVSTLLFVAQMALILAFNELVAGVVLFLPSAWIWWRRLHDMNLSGKWIFAPLAVGFVAGFVRGWNRAASNHAQADVTLTSMQENWFALFVRYPDAFFEGFWRGFVNRIASDLAADPITITVTWAMTLALALWPGTRGPNRFGPEPGYQFEPVV